MLRDYVVYVVSSCVLASAGIAQTGPDERSLWTIWKLVEEKPDDHTAAVAACAEFGKKNPHDPLLVVTRGITAWHLLKSGRTDAAIQVFEPMASAVVQARSDPLQMAALTMGRTWLTRIDRERVKQSLKKLYLRDIEYPASLETLASLPKESRPPLADRWGKPWTYRLVGFRKLRGFSTQKYELQSKLLGRNSDLASALQAPYADGIKLKPVDLLSSGHGKGTVRFTTYSTNSGDSGAASGNKTSRDIIVSVGGNAGPVFFAYMGSRLLVLSDGNHWMVLPGPRR